MPSRAAVDKAAMRQPQRRASVNYAYRNSANMWTRDATTPYSVALGPQDEWLRIDVIT
jgi:hypothetical protein